MPDPQHLAALKAEAERSSARRNADPYDRTAREELARALLEMDGERFPRGSVERGHILLLILSEAFPIPGVRSAYMSNLESLLVSRALRAAPGRVVLGLGSGRCG